MLVKKVGFRSSKTFFSTLISLIIFVIFYNRVQAQAPCFNTDDCTPPAGNTCFCKVECPGTTTGYCTSGTGGTCSCTTSTSTYCTSESQWSGWSGCYNGYEWRACSLNGDDIQIRTCEDPLAPPGSGGGGGGGGEDPPPPSIEPGCNVLLTPSASTVVPGGTVNYSVALSANVTISRADFISGNTSVATIAPASDTSQPYNTVATGVGSGTTTIRVNLRYSGSNLCTDTADITVFVGPWWQVRDSDLASQGSLTSWVPLGLYFGLAGAGGYPGVPSYTTDSNINRANASAIGWVAQSPTKSRVFDFKYFSDKIPQDTVINTITDSSVTGDFFESGGTESYGYYWYKYDGSGTGLPLTINSAVNLGASPTPRKIILLVDSSNLNVNGPINLTDGRDFFLAIVNGEIAINPAVGGSSPDLEGIYIADSVFRTGTAATALRVRGSVVGYDGVSMTRNIGNPANSANPSEIFEYAPDQILMFPPKLGVRKINWKEIAP